MEGMEVMYIICAVFRGSPLLPLHTSHTPPTPPIGGVLRPARRDPGLCLAIPVHHDGAQPLLHDALVTGQVRNPNNPPHCSIISTHTSTPLPHRNLPLPHTNLPPPPCAQGARAAGRGGRHLPERGHLCQGDPAQGDPPRDPRGAPRGEEEVGGPDQ